MANPQRDVAINTHTQNIRAGLPVLKTKYGMTIDEYDYLDIAVDALRDIRNFGTTEYLTIATVDKDGFVQLPCNLDYIDAVTTVKMGLKTFSTRVRYDMEDILTTDAYYLASHIMEGLGHIGRPGLTAGRLGEGYISYQLVDPKRIQLQKEHAGSKVALAYTGISVDKEGYPLINRKQANALAAVAAYSLTLKFLFSGNAGKNSGGMLEFIAGEASRLKQAASIPEDITDNEINEMLDAQTSFNRKTYRRPTKYGR